LLKLINEDIIFGFIELGFSFESILFVLLLFISECIVFCLWLKSKLLFVQFFVDKLSVIGGLV